MRQAASDGTFNDVARESRAVKRARTHATGNIGATGIASRRVDDAIQARGRTHLCRNGLAGARSIPLGNDAISGSIDSPGA